MRIPVFFTVYHREYCNYQLKAYIKNIFQVYYLILKIKYFRNGRTQRKTRESIEH